MTACAKWEMQQRLGIPVENPCGKPAENADLHHVFERDKSLSLREAVYALLDAVELLGARVEALEYHTDAFVSILDQPLSPTESLERLRELREQMV